MKKQRETFSAGFVRIGWFYVKWIWLPAMAFLSVAYVSDVVFRLLSHCK